MKRNFWVAKQGNYGDVIEITVKDSSGAKIETWIFNINDNKKASRVLRILKEKYDFNPKTSFKEEKDLSWLRDDTSPF